MRDVAPESGKPALSRQSWLEYAQEADQFRTITSKTYQASRQASARITPKRMIFFALRGQCRDKFVTGQPITGGKNPGCTGQPFSQAIAPDLSLRRFIFQKSPNFPTGSCPLSVHGIGGIHQHYGNTCSLAFAARSIP
jgi:hypothetical protein